MLEFSAKRDISPIKILKRTGPKLDPHGIPSKIKIQWLK